MPKIKYMGSSHVHTLEKGDDFGGRLSEKLTKDVVFDRDNSWVVDSDEAGLSEDALAILVETEDFKDVTDLKRIPTNLHQQIFLGLPKSEASEDATDEPVTAAADTESDDDTEKNDGDPDATKTGTGGAGSATTAGGSTGGSRRRSTGG